MVELQDNQEPESNAPADGIRTHAELPIVENPEKRKKRPKEKTTRLRRHWDWERGGGITINGETTEKIRKKLAWIGKLTDIEIKKIIPPALILSAIGVIILTLNYYVGPEANTAGITNADNSNRQQRQALYDNKDEINGNTDAEKWANGEWTNYSFLDFLYNLNPTRDVTQPLAFVDICGPQCFFDTTKFPKAGWTVMEEILGLKPDEYQYYSDNLENWDSIKGELIGRLEEKYPANSDYPWLPGMFNLRPTDPKSRELSDFENWYNWWHNNPPQSYNPDIRSTSERVQAVGLTQFRDVFAGRRNLRGAISKGGGFGTSKGL